MTYVTFGSDHVHEVGDQIFDKDCIAAFESNNRTEGRRKAFDLFNNQFCMEYYEDEIDSVDVNKWFSRGVITIST